MADDDVVAYWEVRLRDNLHQVTFEHGSMTGKRVVRVDGQEVARRDWMFKLIGSETFHIGNTKCVIKIEPCGMFSYEYSLEVNGKSFKKFRENQNKILQTWLISLQDEVLRIVLERDTLDVWVNGSKVDVTSHFADEGSERHFDLDGHSAIIASVSSGSRREGIIHTLLVDGYPVHEVIE